MFYWLTGSECQIHVFCQDTVNPNASHNPHHNDSFPYAQTHFDTFVIIFNVYSDDTIITVTTTITPIRKTCPCSVYPLKPHFYIAKLGFAGVYLFFIFLLQNIDCGYSLEPPRRGGSNEYPQSMLRAKIRKIFKIV